MKHFPIFRHSRLTRVNGCIVIATLLTCSVHAHDPTQRVFDVIPLESRPRLVERLNEYLTYERGREYEKLYELIYDPRDKRDSEESYTKARREVEDRRGTIQQFTPKNVMNITLSDDVTTFMILGMAKVLRKGKTSHKEMVINARLQSRDWYFTQLSDSFLHID